MYQWDTCQVSFKCNLQAVEAQVYMQTQISLQTSLKDI